ncbi:MAG: MaoC family dehydratase N-terminal domain-containing protein [Variovorax sp.]
MADVDIDHLREWVGRTQATEQRIDPFPARAMAALLDQDVLPSEGDPLPPPWQWLYFLDTPSREGTGHDGHPKRGGFLPPVQLPRRMWAAGRLDIEAPLRIGADVRKVSSVQSVERKDGNSGPLIFVQVAHEYHQDGRRCLSEVQSLVYREAPKGLAPLSPGEVEVDEAQWSRIVQPDPALLFRFSALTYNGHRIHYDRDYAMREEFYPALVVHGPLQATLLLDLLAHHCADVRIRSFEFRALRPAFDTDAVRLCGRRDGEQVKLWTADPQGRVGMRATAVVA